MTTRLTIWEIGGASIAPSFMLERMVGAPLGNFSVTPSCLDVVINLRVPIHKEQMSLYQNLLHKSSTAQIQGNSWKEVLDETQNEIANFDDKSQHQLTSCHQSLFWATYQQFCFKLPVSEIKTIEKWWFPRPNYLHLALRLEKN